MTVNTLPVPLVGSTTNRRFEVKASASTGAQIRLLTAGWYFPKGM